MTAIAELERHRRPDRGDGPTLMTEYEPYGVRHFLRKADAEGASELRRRVVPLRSGRPLRKLGTADIDEFQLAGIRAYRTLVLRRSPVASRPPSVYRLMSRGRFYDVWQLAPGSRTPFSSTSRWAAPASRRYGRPAGSCGARAPRVGRRAAGSPSPSSRCRAGRPGGPPRRATGGHPARPPHCRRGLSRKRSALRRDRQRCAGQAVMRSSSAARSGGSSISSSTGAGSSTRRHRLSHQGHYEPLGQIDLAAGRTASELRYRPAELAPGSGGPAFPLGPLYVVRESNPRIEVGATRTRADAVWPAARLDGVRKPLAVSGRKVRGPGTSRPSLLCK